MREDAKPTFRRTRRTAAAVGAVTLLTFLGTDPGSAAQGAPSQDGAFNAGTGNAIALGYKVNPVNGNLSFGITAGESVAGHQNTAATGQARAINLGVIGVTLAGKGCDGGDPTWRAEEQPQPVIARSGEKGAEEGKAEKEAELILKKARATMAPFAEAVTEIAPMGDPEAVFITGGRTTSHSGVVGEGVREALARTELGEVSIGGGAIKLKGLTWEAIHRSGAEEVADGSFSIDGLEIAGEAIPLPAEEAEQLAALESVLDPLGVEITPPVTRVEQGIVFVDPLKIAIVSSPGREAVTSPLVEAVQEPRESLVDLLLEQDCSNATYVTVADIVLGSVTGAGSLGLELGGVQATTSEINAFQFPSLPPLPDLGPAPALGGPALSGGSAPSLSGSTPAPATAPPASTGSSSSAGEASEEVATAPIVDLAGERGGLMALVAGGGLAALLASAEADRRKMRHALREIPLEA
ncbi:MAG: hypothetical protein ACLGI8_09780 [Acidimicrobiia bacterium]